MAMAAATCQSTKRSPHYVSNLNDQEFALLAPHIIRTDSQWWRLPSNFPTWSHGLHYYRAWRNDGTLERINSLLHRHVRCKASRDLEPNASIVDKKSVEATK